MAASGSERASDRWITPGVIIAGILALAVIVLGVAGAVTYLTARGIDPGPMLDLVAKVVGAAGALGTLILQLVGRSTVAKVERNTGTLAGAVADALSSLPAAAPTPPAPSPVPAPEPAAAPSGLPVVPDPGTRALPAVPPAGTPYYSQLRANAPT